MVKEESEIILTVKLKNLPISWNQFLPFLGLWVIFRAQFLKYGQIGQTNYFFNNMTLLNMNMFISLKTSIIQQATWK